MKALSKRIFLIGPMGAGKSTLGKALALLMNKAFLDLDELIIKNAGMSIPDIFAKEEERGFRKRETEALRESLHYEAVIATGGGIVVIPENLDILKQNGVVIYLRPDVETQFQRTKRDDGRPMLYAEDRRARLQEIFEYRDPLYKSIADLCVDSGKNDVRSCVEQIKAALKEV